MRRPVRIALVGFGMYGAHEVARSLECLVRFGVTPFVGRIGYPDVARDLAPVTFELTAVGTSSEESASRAADQFEAATGMRPAEFSGETPWEEIVSKTAPDVLVVATPDDNHFAPALHAVEHGIHVLVEKPLALCVSEVVSLVNRAKETGVLLGSDNHKEYDPDHMYIAHELLPQIAPINYGRAYLEEPLQVSTDTFKWIAEAGKRETVSATPFSYVGIHWVSLFQNLYGVDSSGSRILTPVVVKGYGQKNLLLPKYGIDAVDSTVVTVTYDTGAAVTYENNWITPEEFCGITVNQGHEIVGANGKIESDQQNRGLMYWIGKNGPGGMAGARSQRTANTHFFRRIYARHNGSPAGYAGYGMDSITAFFTAAARVLALHHSPDDVQGTYVDGVSQILPCAVIEAGNASIAENLKLRAAQLSPSAECTIDVQTGIQLHYRNKENALVSSNMFDGPLGFSV